MRISVQQLCRDYTYRNQKMNPSKFYNIQLEKQSQIKARLSAKSTLFSTVRVVVFLVFITTIIYELNERELQASILLTILLVIILGVLIKFHNKVKSQLLMATNLVSLSKLELEKLSGNYSTINGGDEFKNDNHAYSADLDLFGEKSIFQLINQTTSFFGKQKLASWLLNKRDKIDNNQNEILKRQSAAKELRDNQEWCLTYRAVGLSEKINKKEVESFKSWLHQEPILLQNKVLKWVIVVLPILALAIGTGAYFYDFTYSLLIPGFIASALLLGKQHKYASKTVNDTFKALATLRVLAKQLSIVEQSSFKSDYLISIKTAIASTKNAGKEINRLHQLLNNLESRNSMMHAFVNIPFLLDIRGLIKLEEWRNENAKHVEEWFEALATTECLISLSGLYFNHPTWIAPSFSEADYYFEATELVHPMLGTKGVSNNFSFKGTGNTSLITGPNMAGKSTFLRTVAVSWVFAQIGAPVRAKEFTINPDAQVFTAMRVKDNLSESVSSFYAELDRIKQLINKIKSGEQCLYFLDEILKGTNSADRHKGAEALIRQLHKLEATGFISTHDLELGELAAKEDFVQNFSFESDITKGKITFDYTIKEGICSSFNACELMRQMGIEVEA